MNGRTMEFHGPESVKWFIGFQLRSWLNNVSMISIVRATTENMP